MLSIYIIHFYDFSTDWIKNLLGVSMRVFSEITGTWNRKLRGRPTLNVGSTCPVS